MFQYERRRIIEKLRRVPHELYWGNHFDVRFYLAFRLRKIEKGLILDVGCGPGIVASERNRYKVFCVGIDLSRETLKIAKQIDNTVQYILSDMHYLPFIDSAFDYVIIANSFSEFDVSVNKKIYSKVPHKILIDEITRVLKGNGRLFLTTPNRYHHYYKNKNKADFRILKESLQKFNFKILGFNPLPITLPALLDVKPLNILYIAFLELMMKLPFCKYISMFFFVEATKKE
jgi:SAM-dependent methyltransferase